jgi:hypothetical protein
MIAPFHHQDDGERRKLDAIALLSDRRDLYVLRGRRALLTALLAVGEATADDVRDALDIPPNIDPVCLGAVPVALARAGIIERVGYVPTCRPDAHARPVSLWALADRAAAVQWLRDHPDRPDDDQAADLDGPQRLLFPCHETATPTGTAAGAAL